MSGTLTNEAGIAAVHFLAACAPSVALLRHAVARFRAVQKTKADQAVGGGFKQSSSPTSLVEASTGHDLDAKLVENPDLFQDLSLSLHPHHRRRSSVVSWSTTPGSIGDPGLRAGENEERMEVVEEGQGVPESSLALEQPPGESSGDPERSPYLTSATKHAAASRGHVWEASVSVIDLSAAAAKDRTVRLWCVALGARGARHADSATRAQVGAQAMSLSVQGKSILSWAEASASWERAERSHGERMDGCVFVLQVESTLIA